jgi:cell fate regulator YaaT (PSP1 superfamily)
MNEDIQQEEARETPRVEESRVAPPKAIPVIDHRLLASKLTVHDWMRGVPPGTSSPNVVEVRFKNTRKGFFANPNNVPLRVGNVVAVEATLGHDIGVVSLTGELVREQARLKYVDITRNPLKKIYRRAKLHDIEKWKQAIALENETMIKSREIAANLQLDMKIGDVEYQGDKTKAIFYYIAGDRVDFRKLIRILADTFCVRIEMKQIGARQEAGRLGGIGSCGRQLCCCAFVTNFVSVSTSAARYQDISLNPQKLAGQCGKLKCCLNFEVDAYVDGQKDFPSPNTWLNTGEGMLYFQKSDVFGRTISYSFDKEGRGSFVKLSVERAKEIIAMNKRGQIPPKAAVFENEAHKEKDFKYTDGVGEESLNRFDDKKLTKHNNKNRNRKKFIQKRETNSTNETGTTPPVNTGNHPRNTPDARKNHPDRNHHQHRDRPRPNTPQAPANPEPES